MKSFTIIQKVYLCCALLAATIVLSTMLILFGARQQAAALEQMVEVNSLLRNHMEADMGHDAIRAEVVSIIAASRTSEIDGPAAGRELVDRLNEFEGHMLETERFKQSPAITTARAAADSDFRLYVATGRKIAAAAQIGMIPDGPQLRQFLIIFTKLEGSMAKISDTVQEFAAQSEAHAEASARLTWWIGIVGLVLGLSVLGMIAFAARRYLIEALLKLNGNVKLLADGKLDIAIAATDRPDEIGSLARSVDTLRDGLIQSRADTAKQADMIVASIGEGLDQLAGGNLAYRIDQPLAGIFERLRVDFNDALQSLGQTMQSVRGSTTELQGVARDIGRAAKDLADRNANQAGNLEETAAALTSLSDRVAGSSEAVRAAKQAVDGVGDEVTRGGKVVQEAEAAMDRIEQASQEISKIISVIDAISFQTNLLALNAGVEAARAGDHGKGFAVVATEVRALAQRSSDAASEIRNLIANSSGEVGQGVKLVREAGGALRMITGRMDEINRMMELVSTSTAQQSVELIAVKSSSVHLEQITQSNAVVAEQVREASTAVVQSVSTVAGELDHFDLGHQTSRAPVRALAA